MNIKNKMIRSDYILILYIYIYNKPSAEFIVWLLSSVLASV